MLQTILIPNESPSESVPASPHRFSVDEFYRMADVGVFGSEARVELLDGLVIDMNPVYAPHAFSVDETLHQILRLLPQGWTARDEKPITLATSSPQPDITVMRGARRDYRHRHPGPADIGLLVEVSDSTLSLDRTAKAATYAAAGIPEYWIVNLNDRQVEVHRNPRTAPAHYADRLVIAEAGRVMLRLDGADVGEIVVANLL
jgi:Uma2 family endonuclease